MAAMLTCMPALASPPKGVATIAAPTQPQGNYIKFSEKEEPQASSSSAEAAEEEMKMLIDAKLASVGQNTVTDLQPADASQLTPTAATLLDSRAQLSSVAIPGLRAATPRTAYVIPESGMKLISKDHSVSGTMSISPMTLTKDTAGQYRLQNVYSWGKQEGYTAPTIDINTASGTVSIPSQQILLHSTYGSVWMVPIQIQDGKFFYSLEPITGTIDANGTIKLPTWGIMVPEGDKAGALFNVFENSEWKVSNISTNSLSTVDGDEIVGWGLIEQPSANEIALYNISGYDYGEVLYATLTSSKTAKMSPQKVFTNMLLGPFYAYSITIGDKVAVNTKSPILISQSTDSTLTMQSWGIVCQGSSSYYVDLYVNSVLSTDFRINWPTAHEADFEGAGTAASPYLIKTANQLAIMAECINEGRGTYATAYYALANDIDFSTITYGFSPIGDEGMPFAGVFDGKGFTIKNFNYNGRGFTYSGLFGYATGGEIRNLNMTDAKVASSGMHCAALAGSSNAAISNINVHGTITSSGEMAAGIVAYSTNTISNSTFKGSVQGVGDVAGIVADSYATISGCSVEADLTLLGYSSMYHMMGGIAGSHMYTNAVGRPAYIIDCNASGFFQDSYGKGTVGGVAGLIANGAEVRTSFNTASIAAQRLDGTESDTSTGGVVGWASAGRITDCYNAGTIIKTGTSDNIGGVIGYISVSYVFSSGSTSMQNMCYVTNCINTGQIISTPDVAGDTKGVLGNTYVYTGFDPIGECISNCYSDTQISIHQSATYGITTDALTSGALPAGFSADIWEARSGFYPTLRSNNKATATQLSAAVMHLADGENVRKVKKNFTLSAGEDVIWKLYFNQNFTEISDALQISGSSVSIKDVYSNSILVAMDVASGYYKMYRVAVVPKVFQGDGTEASPYLISNVADFKKLHNAIAENAQPHEGDYFRMTGDVDFTNAAADGFQGVGYGYVPAYYFGGTFDAAGHSITNFKLNGLECDPDGKALNTSKYYTGFFNAIGPKGVVKNLTIASNCDFKGYYCQGSVAGFSYGRIENCINHAPVSSVYDYCGGIVGYTDETGVVSSCYNDAVITSGHQYVGGIVGGHVGKAILCQNDGDVLAYQINPLFNDGIQGYAGGITGGTAVGSTLDECINQGNVSGYLAVGGITGSAFGTSLSKCINTGLLDIRAAVPTVGAIIGKSSGVANISDNCYFDASVIPNDACNSASLAGTQPLYTGSLTGGKLPAGLNADNFTAESGHYPVVKAFATQPSAIAMSSLYIGFSDKETASNIQKATPLSSGTDIKWTLPEPQEGAKAYFSIADGKLNVSIPTDMEVGKDILTATHGISYKKVYNIQTIPVLFSGTGSENDPYQIKTVADLNTLADFIYKSGYDYANSHFRLMNDIDFAGDTLNIIAKGETAQFSGYFHGDNHTVKGFVYENISVTNTTAKPHPLGYKGYHMGFFGKIGSLGRVENLIVDGSIKLYQYAGGIAGDLYGTLSGCTFKGTVASTATSGYDGGIVSRVYAGSTVEDCTFAGTLSAPTASYNGGIAAIVYEGGVIKGCTNRGYMDSKNCAGIVYNLTGEVLDCVTDSTATFSMAGITAGVVYTATGNAHVAGCTNYADIKSETLSNCSGIISTTSTSSATAANVIVENCTNYGNITSKGYPAGVLTRAYRGTTIRNCANYGTITASGASYCGGVVACMETATAAVPTSISDCANYGEVKGWQSYIGGVTGKIGTLNTATRLRNYGKVSSNVNTGTTHLAVAGVTGSLNGTLTCSFNAGDVNAVGHGTGGLVGVLQSGTLDRCFNLGNISSTGTINYNMGCVGGLVGYNVTAGTITNCYNMGTLYAPKHLSGMVARFNTAAEYSFENCYNNGAVTWGGSSTVPETTSNIYVRGTANTIVYQNNLYYNSDVNTFTSPYDPSGRGRSTKELMTADLGDAWVYNRATLPVLADFADDYEALIPAIEVLYSHEGDTRNNVNAHIYLGTPKDDLIFTTSEHFQQNSYDPGKFHTIKSGTDAWIKVTSPDGKVVKTINFVVNTATGIDEYDADYAEISKVEYFDFTGTRLASPAPGTLCIVRTTYADGKVVTAKNIVK